MQRTGAILLAFEWTRHSVIFNSIVAWRKIDFVISIKRHLWLVWFSLGPKTDRLVKKIRSEKGTEVTKRITMTRVDVFKVHPVSLVEGELSQT